MAPHIYGFVKPGFEAVRDTFAQNFDEGLESGASLSVMQRGETVLDIWAGGESGKPWRQDTIVNVMSTTKGAAALCVAICVDRGLIDYSEKMTKYWPEFGQNGKEGVTVAEALSHQAGVCGIRHPADGPDGAKFETKDIYDWDKVCAQLAGQKPFWPPGTMNGYHGLTYGWLAGELVRRVTGKSCGTFFRENVAEKLGIDFHIGLPEEEHFRAMDIIPAPVTLNAEPKKEKDPNAPPKPELSPAEKELRTAARAMGGNPGLGPVDVGGPHRVPVLNTADWRKAEIPSANGHTNAKALARMYGCLAMGGELDGVRLISPGALRAATKMNCFRKDLVLGFKVRWANGFMLNDPLIGLQGANDGSFGHAGAGGSLGYADPSHGLGFGYAMNLMSPAVNGDPRVLRIIETLYGCLGQPIRYARDEKGLPRQSVRLQSANNGNLNGGMPIAARL